MRRLGTLCDKVLRVTVNQTDHGALHVETPCYKLSMSGEDRVGARDFGGTYDGCGRHEVTIKLSSSLRREGRLVQRLLLHHYRCEDNKHIVLRARLGRSSRIENYLISARREVLPLVTSAAQACAS